MNLIAVTGIDGCGKSTHVRRLATRAVAAGGLPLPTLSVWDIARHPRYQHHPFICDRAAVHQYLATLSGGARALFVMHGLLESWALLSPDEQGVVLADGYWYKYVLTEHLHGENLDWLLGVAGRLPTPKYTVLLDLDPAVAWRRKPRVTPYECGFKNPGEVTFIAFQTRLREQLLALAARERWRVVDVDRPEDAVAADLDRIVREVTQ